MNRLDHRITYTANLASKAIADAIIAEDLERKEIHPSECPRAEYVGGTHPWIITVEPQP